MTSKKKGTQVCVKLAYLERVLLLKKFDLPVALRDQLLRDSRQPLEVWMHVDEAHALREQAGELFQTIGIDEDYRATVEGKLLDDLIDKLHMG